MIAWVRTSSRPATRRARCGRVRVPAWWSGRTLCDEADLIAIDIADAGDLALVEQEGLDRHAAMGTKLTKLRRGELADDRIDAEVCKLYAG